MQPYKGYFIKGNAVPVDSGGAADSRYVDHALDGGNPFVTSVVRSNIDSTLLEALRR